MITHLSSEQVEEYERAFATFDKAGNGKMTAYNLRAVMMQIGQEVSMEECEELILEVDIDGNGSIEFNEFVALMNRKIKDTDLEEDLLESFRMIDKDQDGLISAGELFTLYKQLQEDVTDEEIEAMIKSADSDGDGMVTFEDFTRVINRK